MYAYLSETLLYVCFAFVCGAVIWNGLPVDARPEARLPGSLLFNAVVGIALLSLVPVIKNTLFLTQFAGPFWDIIDDVLLELEFGKAWLWMFGMCTLFLALLALRDPSRNRWANGFAGLLALGLLFSYGWASHAAGQSESWGFLAQSFHLAAASVWIGLLLIAGWFANPSDGWLRFLRWFHPLSVLCVIVIVAAGLIMMAYIVPSYPQSWIISYGQALLVKHLLLIPVVVFGFFNGFALQSRLKIHPQFDPRPWFRVESVIILLLFAATAFMGQQRPPHDDPENPEPLVPSALFRLFHGSDVTTDMRLTFGLQPAGMLLALAAVALLLLLLRSWRRNTPRLAAAFGIGFAVTAFLSILLLVR
ncbi:hypothetical protein D7M11_14735 [Paenibacillus ginsengarvi]|uniref:Copper resistance protein D domain-containing protein n=2 Tax=Paenibacillus ginsengarvi TaxID=400777 RepID=A0A3B0CI35_9BACL|nr:hypothetical protein D7M11_14735 [Paenibacillus ginsengarvi]